MFDNEGSLLYDFDKINSGNWITQHLASGEDIIGIYGCKSDSENGNYIRSLGFIVCKW